MIAPNAGGPLVAICLALAAAGPVSGESASISRVIELPAHRALEELRRKEDTTLAPFTTDGCSGGLSDSWRIIAETFPSFAEIYRDHPPWEDCCVTHDHAYHLAGPDPDANSSFDARLKADEALRQCVQETGVAGKAEYAEQLDISEEQVVAAFRAVGQAMFLAVRFGGGPCTRLPWRWGYGYPHCF